MGWRIPSLSKSHFRSHQLSHLTTVPHIHPAMATKPLQLIKASFTIYKDYDIVSNVQGSDLGCSLCVARTFGLSSSRGDLVEQ